MENIKSLHRKKFASCVIIIITNTSVYF